MYEVRDEDEGGKWFPLIITLSLQMPAWEEEEEKNPPNARNRGNP